MSTRTSRDRNALSTVERALRVVVVGIAALAALCTLVVVVSMASGARPLVFRSGSMSPAIPAGSLAFTRPADARDLAVGDVVTVKVGSGRVTHRIVAVKRHGDVALLQLKGDANKAADSTIYPVREAQRTWFSVPVAGSVTAWLSRPVGGLSLAAYLLLVVLVVGRWRRTLAPNAAPSAAFARRNRAVAGGTAVLTFAAGAFGSWVMPTWAYWTDDANASSATISTGTWDVAPPASAVTGVTPLVNAAGWYNANITVSLTASDVAPSSGVAGIHYILNGSSEQVLSGSTGIVSITTEGTNTLEFWAVDNAGFIESPHHTATYKLDKTPPPAPVFTSISNDTGASSTDRITSVATQTLSGTAEANSTVTVSQGSSPLGTTTADGSGHFSYGPVTLVPGANGFTATAKDVADNQSPSSAGFVVTLDAVAPNSVVISPNDNVWHKVNTWSVTATDALSGVSSVTYQVGANTPTTVAATNGVAVSPPTLPDGINPVQAYATDVAGATTSATPTIANIRVDTVKPTATLTLSTQTGSNGWLLDGSASIAGSDATSGVASVVYTIDSGTPVVVNGTSTTLVVPPGTHTVTYHAVDLAGNIGTDVVVPVKVDTAAPSTTASVSPVPTSGWNNSSVTVTLSPSDPTPGSGLASVQYRLGTSGSFATLSGPTYTIPVSAEGTTTVQYFSTDNAGRTETLQSTTVKIDTKKPTTSAVVTPSSGWNTSTATVTFNPTDLAPSSGIANVQYRLGTSGSFTTLTGPTYTATVSTDGTTTVQYFATDVAGNVEATNSVSVQVDSTKPVLSNPLPANGTSGSTWTALSCAAASNQLCVNASDVTSGIQGGSVSVTLSATSGTNSGKCWAGGTTWSATCTAQTMSVVSAPQYATSGMTAATMPVGNYTATFNAKDVAGNSATTLTVSFTVGTVPAAPVITCGTVGKKFVNINWSAVSGATSYDVYAPDGTTLKTNVTTTTYQFNVVNETGTVRVIAKNSIGQSVASNVLNYDVNNGSNSGTCS